MKLGAARIFVSDISETKKFDGAPEKQHWGGWLATFKDSAGNSLQLVQMP